MNQYQTAAIGVPAHEVSVNAKSTWRVPTSSIIHTVSGGGLHMRASELFNCTWLSRAINRPAGRLFRFAAGMGFLTYGFTTATSLSGKLALAWGPFPFTAGAFDVCFVSGVLGGPFSGEKIRALQLSSFGPAAAGPHHPPSRARTGWSASSSM